MKTHIENAISNEHIVTVGRSLKPAARLLLQFLKVKIFIRILSWCLWRCSSQHTSSHCGSHWRLWKPEIYLVLCELRKQSFEGCLHPKSPTLRFKYLVVWVRKIVGWKKWKKCLIKLLHAHLNNQTITSHRLENRPLVDYNVNNLPLL